MESSTNILRADKPIVAHLIMDDIADPYLQGCRCSNCGETYVGTRQVCAKCTHRDGFQQVRLSNHGHVYNWTIVYRNFPGIKVPFVSVIVDLDGGGTVKGNLAIEPDPANLSFGMAVETAFETVAKTDDQGNHYLGYHFVPAKQGG